MTLRPEDLPVERPEGARAFDFLLGRWRVHNRRLWQPLDGADDWEEFPASLEVRPILGGLGNVDQFRTLIGGTYFEGVSVRLFSLATGLWNIYWTDTSRAELQTPLVGSFDNGVGSFLGVDTCEGKAVKVRFTWQTAGEGSAQWQQSYSIDDGHAWVANWIMDLERR